MLSKKAAAGSVTAMVCLERALRRRDDESDPLDEELDRLISDAFRLASRVGSAAGETHGTALDPSRAFEFGLERILDGIARLIERGG